MIELAKEVKDKSLVGALRFYRLFHHRWVTKRIAKMLHQAKHQQLVALISNKVIKGTCGYPRRHFDNPTDNELKDQMTKAEKLQKKLRLNGLKTEIYREEPFTTAKDSLEFHVYLMIDEKCGKNRYVRIEEVK